MLYKFISSYIVTLTESNPKRFIEDMYIESGTNKLFFISIWPGVEKLVNIFPIIPVFPDNLLDIFSDKIRFSEYYNII